MGVRGRSLARRRPHLAHGRPYRPRRSPSHDPGVTATAHLYQRHGHRIRRDLRRARHRCEFQSHAACGGGLQRVCVLTGSAVNLIAFQRASLHCRGRGRQFPRDRAPRPPCVLGGKSRGGLWYLHFVAGPTLVLRTGHSMAAGSGSYALTGTDVSLHTCQSALFRHTLYKRTGSRGRNGWD